MADQICDRCGRLLNGGDNVRAVILTKFIALKSKRVFALEKPFDCEKLEHMDCVNRHEGD